ncbi:MAG TPA: hypothetical protein ENL44_00280 [Thermoplasmatales archaeon]|nr:MAG: hypothetical protein DRP38_08240 [Thermotogota bacterium]HHF58624.1 hypothetical protein [Thermoplasmatales archaeon]
MRRFAGEYDVVEALKKIFREHKVIVSQKRLKEIVSRVLGDEKVGERRLRIIAINNRIARLKIFTRESKKMFSSDRCPVCNSKISVVKSRDIWGEDSKIEYICRKCGYRSGIRKRIPTKYVFYSRIK